MGEFIIFCKENIGLYLKGFWVLRSRISHLHCVFHSFLQKDLNAVHFCLFTPGQTEKYHSYFQISSWSLPWKNFSSIWMNPLLFNIFDPPQNWHWLVHAVVWDLHSFCPVLSYLLLLVEQCDTSVSCQGSIERQSRVAIFRSFKPLQDLYFNRILRSLCENYKSYWSEMWNWEKRHLLHAVCVAIISVSM